MAKIKIDLVSESALTESNVADLRLIHDKMLELTERAERIIQKSNEIFPAARSSWLRKLKAALGLLALKDGATFEDTINFCQRMVSASSEQKIEDIQAWRTLNGYFLVNVKKVVAPTDVLPRGIRSFSVHAKKRGPQIGTITHVGNVWLFVPIPNANDYAQDFSKSAL